MTNTFKTNLLTLILHCIEWNTYTMSFTEHVTCAESYFQLPHIFFVSMVLKVKHIRLADIKSNTTRRVSPGQSESPQTLPCCLVWTRDRCSVRPVIRFHFKCVSARCWGDDRGVLVKLHKHLSVFLSLFINRAWIFCWESVWHWTWIT